MKKTKQPYEVIFNPNDGLQASVPGREKKLYYGKLRIRAQGWQDWDVPRTDEERRQCEANKKQWDEDQEKEKKKQQPPGKKKPGTGPKPPEI